MKSYCITTNDKNSPFVSLFQCVQPIYHKIPLCPSEKSVDCQRTTRRDIAEDKTLRYFVATFLIEENKEYTYHHADCESPTISGRMPESIFIETGMCILTPEPISAAYFVKVSHQPVSLCVPLTVARQRLGKYVPAATNTHTTI
jgi:hypothetical protein